jgi:hypothetical protein
MTTNRNHTQEPTNETRTRALRWIRVMLLGLASSAFSVFVLTPSLGRVFAERCQDSPALGPLLMLADVAPDNQILGKVAFALLSVLILLPVAELRLSTVITSGVGIMAWLSLGILAAGIKA